MNRHHRRQARRTQLRRLRDEGCTCSPGLVDVPRSEWPTGAVDGLYVIHETGCPFGDRFVPINALGITPFVFYAVRGCGR